MAKLVFKLKDVSEEEALAVRNLLDEHRIDFYETSGGNWGISMAGIWIKDDDRKAEARALIDDFQKEYSEKMQAVHREQDDAGEAETFLQSILRHPLRFLIHLIFIVLIGYFSTSPFIELGQ